MKKELVQLNERLYQEHVRPRVLDCFRNLAIYQRKFPDVTHLAFVVDPQGKRTFVGISDGKQVY